MREELKGRNLSFTEIAKLVGENWQNLTAAEKEPFESQAQAIKDKYLSDLANYKKTAEYRKYTSYLQEFKAKHASPSQGKLECLSRTTTSLSNPSLTCSRVPQTRMPRRDSGFLSLGVKAAAPARHRQEPVGAEVAPTATGGASHQAAGRGWTR